MKRALFAVFGSLFYAAMRGRVLIALILAYLALALPSTMVFARAARENTNHRADPALFANELDFTVWFDLREKLAAAEPALLASVLGAFLLGLFTAGGWLEVLSKREGAPGLKVFCSGGGARFFRFLRLAILSLAAIAFARWIIYGLPGTTIQTMLTGSTETAEFSTEGRANLFLHCRTFLFASCVVVIVLISDLGRAALVIRGGRSAFMAALHGISLFVRRPLAAATACTVPFAIDVALLYGGSWLIDIESTGEPTHGKLFSHFLTILLLILARELTRAGRLGALLAIADADSDARLERRFGLFADPVVAAAGRAMTDDEG